MSPSTEAVCEEVVSWNGLGVCLASSSAADIAWLLRFLTPWFGLDGGPADCRVELIADDALYRRLLADGEELEPESAHCFSLDREALRLPLWTIGADQEVVFDERLRCIYLIERRAARVRIVAPAGNLSARFAAMRVARELAMELARADGHLLLHASCLAAGDGALLVAAPKEGGKTSVLLGGLLDRGFDFVSNDRVVVRRGAADLVAHGMPTLVSIRRQALEWNPALRRTLEGAIASHWLTLAEETSGRTPADWNAASVDLTPVQVCEILGVEARPSAPVGALLFPRVDGGGAGEIAELSASEAGQRIAGALFGFGGERTPTIFASLLPRSATSSLPVVTNDVVERVPSFEVVLGAAGVGGRALREILDRAAAVPFVSRPQAGTT